MNTLETLSDAFTELERRADAAGQQTGEGLTPLRVRHNARVPLVAAAVVATLGVAGGAALLANSGGHSTHAPAGGTSQSAPDTQTSPTAAAASGVPQSADELAARFRAVLGDLATFTVTDTGAPVTVTLPPAPSATAPRIAGPSVRIPNAGAPSGGTTNGAAIVGTLTSGGVTGGYDIQMFQSSPGSTPTCDDPDRAHCTINRLADGNSVAVGREPLPTGGAGGVTYQVDFIRGDGVEILMHLSNERDPKGDSAVLAPTPPLTTEQMVSIVTSGLWG